MVVIKHPTQQLLQLPYFIPGRCLRSPVTDEGRLSASGLLFAPKALPTAWDPPSWGYMSHSIQTPPSQSSLTRHRQAVPCVPQRPARPIPRVCLPFALESPGDWDLNCLAQRSDLVPSAGLGIQSAPWIQGLTSGSLRTSVLSLLRSPLLWSPSSILIFSNPSLGAFEPPFCP